jgi:hypothetical protein
MPDHVWLTETTDNRPDGGESGCLDRRLRSSPRHARLRPGTDLRALAQAGSVEVADLRLAGPAAFSATSGRQVENIHQGRILVHGVVQVPVPRGCSSRSTAGCAIAAGPARADPARSDPLQRLHVPAVRRGRPGLPGELTAPSLRCWSLVRTASASAWSSWSRMVRACCQASRACWGLSMAWWVSPRWRRTWA